MRLFSSLAVVLAIFVGETCWGLREDVILKDFESIFKAANLARAPIITYEFNTSNKVKIICKSDVIEFQVFSQSERASTAYYALKKLGFLFPHPRIQISPTPQDVQKNCGKEFTWRPAFASRGFHLHTQHPSEWVSGFFEGKAQIAQDFIRWLARNQQNVLQLQMLRTANLSGLPALVTEMHDFGISFGFSGSFSLLQQKSFYLIPLWRALTGWGDEEALRSRIVELSRQFNFDYLSLELGTTEFTSTPYEKTLRWLQIADETLESLGKKLFTKIHVSSNQSSEKWGNFNFLPSFSKESVGVQAHTVFFYGLTDVVTPVYERKNFEDMKTFILKEVSKRTTWYYPETSYFVGLDIDVPLFLTDYLKARSSDARWVYENKVPGHINFTTGQELGYWLFDWNVALMSDLDCDFDPLCGLKLLKEDVLAWTKILEWQNYHFKLNQVISMITTSNLMDEIPYLHSILQRRLLKDLGKDKLALDDEILKLLRTIEDAPSFSSVKNQELYSMLQVTLLRVQQALALREALLAKRNNGPDVFTEKIEHSRQLRIEAKKILQVLVAEQRYPESLVFERRSNPTSYAYGYGWPAKELYFWEREERMVEKNNPNPFFMNLYNPIELLF